MIPYKPPKVAPLPVIDIGKERDEAAIARELRTAALDTGFFYVANHGVPPETIANAFTALPRFFGLPPEAKERLRRGKGRKGYEGTGVQIIDAGSPPDLKESWNMGWERDPTDPNPPVNQWPEGLPGFREALEAYYGSLEDVGARLIRFVALSLELPADYFAAAFDPPSTSLRTLCYPPQPEDAQYNQMGAGAHTDIGVLTILAQDDCGGLELCNVAGEWLSAQVIPGTFVVNIGDMLARWTNDRYRSSLHRVMHATTQRSRYSMAFFFSPRYATTIAPLPCCLEQGEKPKYEPVLAGEFSAMRLARSRLHLQDVALQG
jgi:isopenicillin N synthase-like dioxygenase